MPHDAPLITMIPAAMSAILVRGTRRFADRSNAIHKARTRYARGKAPNVMRFEQIKANAATYNARGHPDRAAARPAAAGISRT